MLPYAGYVDPESTLAIGVHHDGHLEATERTFCSLYHTFMFGTPQTAVLKSLTAESLSQGEMGEATVMFDASVQ